MASPIFLHELPIEQLKKMSVEDIEQTIKAENLYFQYKPKTTYHLAVNGSKTRNGGLVKASSNLCRIKGLGIARVGDDVLYADGMTSKIISGSGNLCLIEGIPVALVGSRLENGDEIIESPNTTMAINIFKDQPIPKDFLDHEVSNG